jgi:hypothetical protein
MSIVIASAYGAFLYLLDCRPTFEHDVFDTAVFLWMIMIFYGLWNVIITIYRWHKDPIFKDANIKLGLSWKDYQRIKHEQKESKDISK